MDTSGHRALAEPSRARILETLAAAGEPLDAAELAERVGLHPNTVRWHLGVLADAGFVTSSPRASDAARPAARRLHARRGAGRGARGLPPAGRHPRRLALGHGGRRCRGRAGRRGLGPLPRRAAAAVHPADGRRCRRPGRPPARRARVRARAGERRRPHAPLPLPRPGGAARRRRLLGAPRPDPRRARRDRRARHGDAAGAVRRAEPLPRSARLARAAPEPVRFRDSHLEPRRHAA